MQTTKITKNVHLFRDIVDVYVISINKKKKF